MVNTYDLIKELEELGLFKKLLTKGIVSVKYLNDKEMYERFLEMRKDKIAKTKALYDVADEFGVSFETAKRVVRKMKG